MARDTVRGDKEFARALRQLSHGPTAREVDGMANRAMSPMLEDVKSRLRQHRNYASKYPSFFPKQRGKFGRHLDSQIAFRKDGQQSRAVRRYKLGGTGRARFLLHLLEFGASAHFQPNLGGGFMHPGSTPRPSMVPSFESKKSGVIRDFQFLTVDWLQRRSAQLGLRMVRR